MSNTTLQLQKQSRGYYTNTVGPITITVSDSSIVTGGKPQWQITIEDKVEILFNEFGRTKKEVVQLGVQWVLENL